MSHIGGDEAALKAEALEMISLGSTLRKNSKVFHRLPTGQFGLLIWYPNAKAEKGGRESEGSLDETKSAASKKPTADQDSSDASGNHDEAEASETPAEGD